MNKQETVDSPASRVIAEIVSGQGKSPAHACRLFPSSRFGKFVSPATVWRWMTVGVTIPSGKRLRLESARVGAAWMTSVPAITRFLEAQTKEFAAELDADPEAIVIDGRRRKREVAAERAGAELQRIGA